MAIQALELARNRGLSKESHRLQHKYTKKMKQTHKAITQNKPTVSEI